MPLGAGKAYQSQLAAATPAEPEDDDGGGFLGLDLPAVGGVTLLKQFASAVPAIANIATSAFPGGQKSMLPQFATGLTSSLFGTAATIAKPFGLGFGDRPIEALGHQVTKGLGSAFGIEEPAEDAWRPRDFMERVDEYGLLPAAIEDIGNVALVAAPAAGAIGRAATIAGVAARIAKGARTAGTAERAAAIAGAVERAGVRGSRARQATTAIERAIGKGVPTEARVAELTAEATRLGARAERARNIAFPYRAAARKFIRPLSKAAAAKTGVSSVARTPEGLEVKNQRVLLDGEDIGHIDDVIKETGAVRAEAAASAARRAEGTPRYEAGRKLVRRTEKVGPPEVPEGHVRLYRGTRPTGEAAQRAVQAIDDKIANAERQLAREARAEDPSPEVVRDLEDTVEQLQQQKAQVESGTVRSTEAEFGGSPADTEIGETFWTDDIEVARAHAGPEGDVAYMDVMEDVASARVRGGAYNVDDATGRAGRQYAFEEEYAARRAKPIEEERVVTDVEGVERRPLEEPPDRTAAEVAEDTARIEEALKRIRGDYDEVPGPIDELAAATAKEAGDPAVVKSWVMDEVARLRSAPVPAWAKKAAHNLPPSMVKALTKVDHLIGKFDMMRVTRDLSRHVEASQRLARYSPAVMRSATAARVVMDSIPLERLNDLGISVERLSHMIGEEIAAKQDLTAYMAEGISGPDEATKARLEKLALNDHERIPGQLRQELRKIEGVEYEIDEGVKIVGTAEEAVDAHINRAVELWNGEAEERLATMVRGRLGDKGLEDAIMDSKGPRMTKRQLKRHRQAQRDLKRARELRERAATVDDQARLRKARAEDRIARIAEEEAAVRKERIRSSRVQAQDAYDPLAAGLRDVNRPATVARIVDGIDEGGFTFDMHTMEMVVPDNFAGPGGVPAGARLGSADGGWFVGVHKVDEIDAQTWASMTVEQKQAAVERYLAQFQDTLNNPDARLGGWKTDDGVVHLDISQSTYNGGQPLTRDQATVLGLARGQKAVMDPFGNEVFLPQSPIDQAIATHLLEHMINPRSNLFRVMEQTREVADRLGWSPETVDSALLFHGRVAEYLTRAKGSKVASFDDYFSQFAVKFGTKSSPGDTLDQTVLGYGVGEAIETALKSEAFSIAEAADWYFTAHDWIERTFRYEADGKTVRMLRLGNGRERPYADVVYDLLAVTSIQADPAVNLGNTLTALANWHEFLKKNPNPERAVARIIERMEKIPAESRGKASTRLDADVFKRHIGEVAQEKGGDPLRDRAIRSEAARRARQESAVRSIVEETHMYDGVTKELVFDILTGRIDFSAITKESMRDLVMRWRGQSAANRKALSTKNIPQDVWDEGVRVAESRGLPPEELVAFANDWAIAEWHGSNAWTKLRSFRDNLANPETSLSVTLDSWMARAFGVDGWDTTAQYAEFARRIRDAAEAWTEVTGKTVRPHQLQALLWVHTKLEISRQNVEWLNLHVDDLMEAIEKGRPIDYEFGGDPLDHYWLSEMDTSPEPVVEVVREGTRKAAPGAKSPGQVEVRFREETFKGVTRRRQRTPVKSLEGVRASRAAYYDMLDDVNDALRRGDKDAARKRAQAWANERIRNLKDESVTGFDTLPTAFVQEALERIEDMGQGYPTMSALMEGAEDVVGLRGMIEIPGHPGAYRFSTKARPNFERIRQLREEKARTPNSDWDTHNRLDKEIKAEYEEAIQQATSMRVDHDALPPVPEGHVRLFRGASQAETTTSHGTFWSPDADYVTKYPHASGDVLPYEPGQILYVDVPQHVYDSARRQGSQAAQRAVREGYAHPRYKKVVQGEVAILPYELDEVAVVKQAPVTGKGLNRRRVHWFDEGQAAFVEGETKFYVPAHHEQGTQAAWAVIQERGLDNFSRIGRAGKAPSTDPGISVYRVISGEDWDRIQAQGYVDTAGGRNISGQGTRAYWSDHSTESSYWPKNLKPGDRAVVIRVDFPEYPLAKKSYKAQFDAIEMHTGQRLHVDENGKLIGYDKAVKNLRRWKEENPELAKKILGVPEDAEAFHEMFKGDMRFDGYYSAQEVPLERVAEAVEVHAIDDHAMRYQLRQKPLTAASKGIEEGRTLRWGNPQRLEGPFGAGSMEELAQMFFGQLYGQLSLPKSGNLLVRFLKGANAETLLHENLHLLRQMLSPEEMATLRRGYGLKRWPKQGTKAWTEFEERFVRDALRVMRYRDFASLDPGLRAVWHSIDGEIAQIRTYLTGSTPETSPFVNNVPEEVIDVLDRALKPDNVQENLFTPETLPSAPQRVLPEGPIAQSMAQVQRRAGETAGQFRGRAYRFGRAAEREATPSAREVKLREKRVRVEREVRSLEKQIHDQAFPELREAERLERRAQRALDQLSQEADALDLPLERYPAQWQPLVQAVRGLREEAAANPALLDYLEGVPETFGQVLQWAAERGFSPTHVSDMTTAQAHTALFGHVRLGHAGRVGEEFTSGLRRTRRRTLNQAGVADRSIEALAAANVMATHELYSNALVDFIEKHVARRIQRGEAIPDDWTTWSDKRHFIVTGERMGAGARETVVGQDAFIIPRYVDSALRHMERPYGAWPFHMISKVTNPWRTLLLTYSPRWYLNNFIGNIMLTMYEMKGVNIAAWKRAIKNFRSKEWVEGQKVRLTEYPELRTRSFFSGLEGDEGAVLTETAGSVLPTAEGMRGVREMRRTEGFKPAWREVNVRLRRANEAFDEIARAAVFEHHLLKGASREQALTRAYEALVDYGNLSSIERQMVRAVVPFYSWQKGMLKLLAKFPVDHPAASRVAQMLGIMNMEMLEDRLGALPSGYLGFVYSPSGGTAVSTRALNPFQDAYMLSSPEGIAEAMNPFVDAIIRDALDAPQGGFAEKFGLTPFGTAAPEVESGQLLAETAATLPQTRLAQQILPFTEDPYGQNLGIGEAFGRFSGLPRRFGATEQEELRQRIADARARIAAVR